MDEEVKKEADRTSANIERKIGLIALILLGVLILLGILFYNLSRESVDRYYFDYNGIQFAPAKKGFGYDMTFYVNDASYATIMSVRNDPRKLEDISIDADYVRKVTSNKKVVYITEDPYDNLTGPTLVAANEIAIPLTLLYGIEVNKTLTRTSDELSMALEEQTVKTCVDSINDVLVIWQRLGNETAVFEEDGCLIVQGKSPDEMEIIRAADRLYLTMIGIMS